jgi:RNA recognition motif-containing protein
LNIFVGNLSFSTRDEDLRAAFAKFGQVDSAQVVMDRDSGRSRGFGFVEMPDNGAAQQAISALNGADLQGRPLTVNEARPKPARGGGGGGGGGGRGPRW